MQPYFFPYIGYFQLIGAVDLFIVYDNIKYTKKGWINRNRILEGGKDAVFSIPLRGDSDTLNVRDRALAADFNRAKLLNKVRSAYARAPYFADVYPMIERSVHYENQNLFSFLHHALICTCRHLGLTTPIQVSSAIDIDHSLKSQEKVIALAKAVGAVTYVNAIGGVDLYDGQEFASRGLDLKFIRSKPLVYPQFGSSFVPWLSIVDVLMFNPLERVSGEYLNLFDFV